jgi:hypothetical protein
MRLPEALDEARHEVLAAGRIGADDEPAQPTVRRALHRARALQAQRPHALRIGQQCAACLAELEGVAVTHEQARAQLRLERRDAPAQRWLREIEQYRRARKAARARDLDEGFELVEVHRASLSRIAISDSVYLR